MMDVASSGKTITQEELFEITSKLARGETSPQERSSRREREGSRAAAWKSFAAELLGCILLFASLGLFAWLCCVTSGYHWE